MSKAEEHLPFPEHLINLSDSTDEVSRLVQIHAQVAGTGRGKKTGVEVLNKSAVVLLVACWESFVEELTIAGFDYMLKRAKRADVFPKKVLALAAKNLRESTDETKVWKLAGSGWKRVLRNHRDTIVKKHVVPFNTPRQANIDKLFESLLGLKKVSEDWYWQKAPRRQVTTKLDELVTLRGEIGHKVQTQKSVRKKTVIDYSHFIKRLAGITSNSVAVHIQNRLRVFPWDTVEYMGQKEE
jgi:hypothetical protein